MKKIFLLIIYVLISPRGYAQDFDFVQNIIIKYSENFDYQLGKNLFFDSVQEGSSYYRVTRFPLASYEILSSLKTGQTINGLDYNFPKSTMMNVSYRREYREYVTYESGLRYFDLENDKFRDCEVYHYFLSNIEDYEIDLNRLKKDFTFNEEKRTYNGYTKIKYARKKVEILPVELANNSPDRIILRGFKIILSD